MEIIKNTLLSGALMVAMSTNTVMAGDDWYVSTTLSGVLGSYSDSTFRNDVMSANFLLNADYLENVSFAVGYNGSNVDFKDPIEDIKQTAFAGRFQYHIYSDALGGRLTTQLVYHSVSNDDTTKLTDGVDVIAPKLAFLNFKKDLYLDVGFSKSDYPNNSNLTVKQFAPTFGFAFNDSTDWLNIKAYLIKSSDKDLSQGEDSFSSVDVKWTHWLGSNAILGIDNFSIGVLGGKRIFAVDNDALAVYNLADIQKGAASFGVTWKIRDEYEITTILGLSKFENLTSNVVNAYTQQYLYLSLKKNWE